MAARKRTVAKPPPDEWTQAASASEAAQVAPEPPVEPRPGMPSRGSVDIPASFVAFCARYRADEFALEPGQLALSRVMFDCVDPIDIESDVERGIATRMFGADRLDAKARHASPIVMALCGRRGGKTSVFAWRAVHIALTLPLHLMPGESAYVPIVAPRTEDAGQALDMCEGCARIVAPSRVSEASSRGFTLERHDGVKVRFAVMPAAAKGTATRGKVFPCALIDEAAFLRGEGSVVNDKEIIDSIIPGIAEGGQLLIATTPWTREGEVFALWERNFGHPKDSIIAHAPTWELRIAPHIIAIEQREKERDPWNHRREYGAEFLDGRADSFFEHDALEACVVAEAA